VRFLFRLSEVAALGWRILATKGGDLYARVFPFGGRGCAGLAGCCTGGDSDRGVECCYYAAGGCGGFRWLVLADSHRGGRCVLVHETVQEGDEQGDVRSAKWRVRRRTLAACVVGLFAVFPAAAHLDGNPEDMRHHYRVATSQTLYGQTPVQACTDFCENTQNRCYHAYWYDGSTQFWRCQCKDISCSTAGSITNFHSTSGNEKHCDLAWRFTGGLGGSCVTGGPANCYARAGEYRSFISVSAPLFFNIPDDGSADGTVWEGLENCSIQRISSTGNNGCWNVTYQITGSSRIDEDGLPSAQNDGTAMPDGILSLCDPETGNPVEGGGWGGSGGGGGLDLSAIIEEHGDATDPLVEGEAELEEETGSWLDVLAEPEEWTDTIFETITPNFALWSPLQDTCSEASHLTVSLPALLSAPARQVQFNCADTEQVRHWLGVVVAVAFGWWLLNMMLSLPKTGG